MNPVVAKSRQVWQNEDYYQTLCFLLILAIIIIFLELAYVILGLQMNLVLSKLLVKWFNQVTGFPDARRRALSG